MWKCYLWDCRDSWWMSVKYSVTSGKPQNQHMFRKMLQVTLVFLVFNAIWYKMKGVKITCHRQFSQWLHKRTICIFVSPWNGSTWLHAINVVGLHHTKHEFKLNKFSSLYRPQHEMNKSHTFLMRRMILLTDGNFCFLCCEETVTSVKFNSHELFLAMACELYESFT